FFQAEDGIRYATVTVVQTCALPILNGPAHDLQIRNAPLEVRNKITFIKGSVTDLEIVRRAIQEADYVLHPAARTSVPRSVKDPRSEERRVGQEGRNRGTRASDRHST